MLSRIMAGLLFAIPLVLIITVSCNNPWSAEKERNLAGSAVIPSIDANVPTVTETATFALG